MDAQANLDSQQNPYRSPCPAPIPPTKLRTVAIALVLLYLAISTVGCVFIYECWRLVNQTVAVTRCVGFAVIMAGAHYLGYSAWRRQELSAESHQNAVVLGISVWQRRVPRWAIWLIVLFLLSWALLL